LRLADYYPRRFVRLYVPVWGAVAVALVLHVVISHHAIPQASIWLDNHSVGIHLGSVAHDCTLIFGAGGFDTTSVLWSLRWEVIFSLGLPVVVWLMLRAPAALVVLGCLAISAADPTSQWAIYLPPFVVGAALATQFERIHQIRASAGATLFLTAVVVGGLTSNWWLGSSTLAQHIAPASVTVGAALAVLLPLASRRTQQILETSPVQWLGTRSYSLYLVHEPVVVCIAFLLHGRGWLLLLVLSIPAALALTEAFFRLVERPSHRLSRRVGGFATKHLPAAFQPTVNASS
jgi:peptidoglycan/LPS O-acetylase OafA/YrhL